MVGQIYPWNKLDESDPVLALLVPVSSAIDEYKAETGLDITRHEFVTQLRKEGTLVFNNIEEFVKYRDNLKKLQRAVKAVKPIVKRNISEERRNQLKEQINSIRPKSGPSISKNP